MSDRMNPKLRTTKALLLLSAIIITGLLTACSPRAHLHWTCEERYNICLEQCESNNDFLHENITNLAVIEQELVNCQQGCVLKYQYCKQSGCVSCR